MEAVYPDAQFFVNVDDDVIYNPHWFSKLLEAQKELQAFGLNGIFTALNMPWRKPFAELHTQANTYLLKWKPPALNWLIPRRVYDRVGPFVDDGIAYDTSYSHWLRLHGFPTICLTPSYVQNIGTYGAYSRDNKTTATDFVGEYGGRSVLAKSPKRLIGKMICGFSNLLSGWSHLNLVAPYAGGPSVCMSPWAGVGIEELCF